MKKGLRPQEVGIISVQKIGYIRKWHLTIKVQKMLHSIKNFFATLEKENHD